MENEDEVRKLKLLKKSENENEEPEVKEQKPQKYSYEQLAELCARLSSENKKMYAYISGVDRESYFKRLDYLFKIVENYAAFDEEIVSKAISEIKEMLFEKDKSQEPQTDGEES